MKEWLKVFKKLPIGYQKLISTALQNIIAGDFSNLDIKDMGNNEYRCRVGKYRIRFRRKTDGSFMVTKLGTRGDIYKS